MLWKLADFSGLRVVTYCLMDNHFHILIEVPNSNQVDDTELVRRFSVLYPKPTQNMSLRAADLKHLLLENKAKGQALRHSLLSRMGNLSVFMKALKQRFTLWYNRTHETYGAFWAERFKSVLVEGRGFVMQAMAAYIDLNPVRAGLVKDPKQYRFCGYAEAVSGQQQASHGIKRVMRTLHIPDGEAIAAYRSILFARGSVEKAGNAHIPKRLADGVLKKQKGELALLESFQNRVRFFTESLILGSEPFLKEMMKDPRCALTKSGRRRKTRTPLGAQFPLIKTIGGRAEERP